MMTFLSKIREFRRRLRILWDIAGKVEFHEDGEIMNLPSTEIWAKNLGYEYRPKSK
jgi:hypothetical protein